MEWSPVMLCAAMARRKRALAAGGCCDLVFDDYFAGCWTVRHGNG